MSEIWAHHHIFSIQLHNHNFYINPKHLFLNNKFNLYLSNWKFQIDMGITCLHMPQTLQFKIEWAQLYAQATKYWIAKAMLKASAEPLLGPTNNW